METFENICLERVRRVAIRMSLLPLLHVRRHGTQEGTPRHSLLDDLVHLQTALKLRRRRRRYAVGLVTPSVAVRLALPSCKISPK